MSLLLSAASRRLPRSEETSGRPLERPPWQRAPVTVRQVIWLLRHGEAADGSPDAERPLTAEGERQGDHAGRALAALGVALEACLTSPKVRAVATARRACVPVGLEPIHESRLYEGPFDPREVAAGFEDVLLVGHDPDLSMAVHELTGAQVRLPKGGLAGIDRGELSVLMRPSELAAIAG